MLNGSVIYHLPLNENIVVLKGAFKVYEGEEEGFIISPFDREENRFIIINEEKDIFPVGNNSSGMQFRLHEADALNDHFTSYGEYTENVKNCVDAIANGKLQKVVLSRCELQKLPDDFDALAFFHKLVSTYPEAFTYLLSVPMYGTWIGATPELLLQAEDMNIHTMALAGTKNHEGTLDNAFTEKEVVEQQVVKDYVREIMDKYCNDVSLIQGIRQAGNLEHIVTNFKGILKEH